MKAHYEKIIVACCFLFIFVNTGMGSTSFSVYMPYLVAMPDVGHTGASMVLAVRTLVSLASMLFIDRYYRLLDVRVGVAVACGFTAAGFFVYAWADSFVWLLVAAVIVGIGYGMGGMTAMTYVANRWFASGVGSVIGFASVGSGIASIVIPFVAVRLIEGISLSVAFAVEASAALFIGLIMLALLRNRPSDLGMEPYRREVRTVRKDGAGARAVPARKLLSAPAGEYRVLLLAMVCVGFYCCGPLTYYTVLVTTYGQTTLFAATMLSVAGICLSAAKFVVGELFDRISTPVASSIMFACVIVGLVLCCFAGLGNTVVLTAAAVLVGTGLSLGTVGTSVWSLELSAPEDRVRVIKQVQVAYNVGGFLANTLPGPIHDLTGTYIVSYVGMLACAVAAAVIVIRYYRKFTVRENAN